METQNENNYASPVVKTIELQEQSLICTSDPAGTESMYRQSELGWE